MSHKLARIMVQSVVTVQPSTPAKEAAKLMNLHEIGCLVVVSQGKPVGIVTERDMLKRVILGSNRSSLKVHDIMSKPLVTAAANTRAGDAAKMMFERNIKKLPVVDDGQLVGLVTLTDLIRTEGVIEYLSSFSLDGTSERMKKAADIYFDHLRRHRRRCPLIMKGGFSMGCQEKKCMWWADDECAVTKLTRQMTQM